LPCSPWTTALTDTSELGLFYPAVATLAGQPATAFPVGLTYGGLPIGLQAIGPYLEDRTPIRFAALVALEFGGFTRPPGYDAD
jgi:amidase